MKLPVSVLFRRVLLCLLLCCAAPSLLSAAEPHEKNGKAADKKEKQYVEINFPEIDINILIKLISEMTGKNFIVDPNVRGKVTIISPEKISVEDAYRVFESVLEVHGFATVPSGAVTKIVPAQQARTKSIPTVFKGESSLTDDKIVTRIIPIRHSTPEEVRKTIQQLVSKSAVVIPHEASNLLIITDALSSINRLLEIIKAVDVPTENEELEIIPLKYASVESISKSAGQLFTQTALVRRPGSSPGSPQQTVRIIPYERSNALIVFAPREQIEKLKKLIAQLDTEVTTRGGNIHVYCLQHANAEEMVKVLTSLPTGKQGKEADNSKVVQPGAAGQQQAKPEQSMSATQAAIQSVASAQLSSDIKITADPETNTLIITASQEEYQTLEEVIRQIDIPRRMVYLEALIMEVSTDKQFAIGAEWGGLGSFHDETGTLGSGFSKNKFELINGVSKGTAGGMAAGATLGLLKKGVKIGGTYFPNIGAIVNTYQTDSDINIIATPQILTTDNKEASITVGENVPYITSKNTTTGSTQDYTNYEYKDVGTTLKITPQINQADLLRLAISVEVTRLKSEAGVATPTTYKRNASTTVVVHNQEIVVIGGMIGQDDTSSNYKVPLLGDVPVLGWLFKTHEKIGRKTNMFIFIAPKIVDSAPELADLYYKKRDRMKAVNEEVGKVPERMLKDEKSMENAYTLMDQGFAKMQAKKPDEARNYFQQALQNAPDNPYALLNLGVLYAQEGESGKAADTYQQVIDLAGRKGEDGSETDAALLAAARAHLRDLRQQEKKAEPVPQKKEETEPPSSNEAKSEPEQKKAEPAADAKEASGSKHEEAGKKSGGGPEQSGSTAPKK